MWTLLTLSLLACTTTGTIGVNDDATTDAGVDTDTDTPVPDTDTDTEPTDPTEAAIVSVTEAAGPVIVTERRLTIELSEEADVWAVCTADTEPDDEHLVESTGPATTHTLVFQGLLADALYDCEVVVPGSGDSDDITFITGVPTGIPRMVVTEDPGGGRFGTYTLFNTQNGGFSMNQDGWVVIADPDGKVRWAYSAGTGFIADLDATLIDSQTVHVGGGWGIGSDAQPNRGVFRTVDLSGTALIDRSVPDYGLGFNHHSEPLDDGSYLSLTFSDNQAGNEEWKGVGVEQWHPQQGLVWTWDSQQLIDDGTEPVPEFDWWETDPSPYHANSITLITDALGDAAYISLYAAKEIWRIDVATGERTHVIGPGGDLALLDTSGAPLPEGEWMYVQHDPDYTTDGRMLVYDNGYQRPGADYSRVAEYQLDLVNNTATLLWSWTEPGWYNPIVGDADYLPNGNVLITRGFSLEWSPFSDDVSQINEIEPSTGRVVWRMEWTNQRHMTFRGERYEGCDVFANARYCPDVAERISELRANR